MQPEFGKIQSFKNSLINKRSLKDLMYKAFLNYGIVKSSIIADRVKNLTFHYATKSGISISIEDLHVPYKKRELIGLTSNEVEITKKRYNIGSITSVERFQKTIDIWNNANNFLKDEVLTYFRESDPLNPLYIMAFSGARGNISQVRQLVGMRGLMANPQGQIIDLPIRSNFREGLTVTEYIISSYGARKGLVDTAIRTADSGYLTRRLVDVAQDIIVREEDCGTKEGLAASELASADSLNLRGRLLAEPFFSRLGQLVAPANTEITETFLNTLKGLDYKSTLKVRSPLTCNSNRSVCRNCYGWHLSHSKLVDLGEAVGIVAAQSIGEPGTQLTMRTFHTGGVFSGDLTQQVRSPISGQVQYSDNMRANLFRTMHGKIGFRIKKPVDLVVKNSSGTTISLTIPTESLLLVNSGQEVYENEIIAEIQKEANLILEEEQKEIYSESSGEVFFNDLKIETQTDKQGNTYKTNQKAGLIWILQGSFYQLSPFEGAGLKPGQKLSQNKLLSHLGIFNRYEGQIFIDRHQVEPKISVRNFSVTVANAIVEKHKNEQYLIRVLNGTQKFDFGMTNSTTRTLKAGDIIGKLIDNTYRTNHGGIVTYNLEKPQTTKRKKSVKNLFHGYFYWIPENTYKVMRNITFRVKNGERILPGSEILPNIFSSIGGVVQIDETEQELLVKPGELFKISEFTNKEFDHSSRFVKPGEFIIPDKIIAQRLVFLEFLEKSGHLYVLARPVVTYSVPREKYIKIKQTFFPKNSREHVRLKIVKRVFYKNWEKVNINQGVNLLQTFLVIDTTHEKSELEPRLELIKKRDSDCWGLKISLFENLKIEEHKRRNSSSELTANVRYLVSNGQYIASKTLVAQMETSVKHESTLASVNSTQGNDSLKEILVLHSSDLKKISLHGQKLETNILPGKLVRIGTPLTEIIRSPYSGQVFRVEKNHILIRLGRPYLISPGTILHVNSKTLVKNGDILATLVYGTIKTTDIVQGLPKVEELLEARKVLHTCHLAPCPGYAYFRLTKNRTGLVRIVGLDGKIINLQLSSNIKVKFRNGEFIDVGEPLTDGLINPHTKLDTLFSYYTQKYSLVEACKLSFKNLQLFLIGEIQKTYRSQGVDIADKHVEIIVKQMTAKVCVEDSGTTTFLPGEVLNFQKMAAITNAANKKGEIAPLYTPLLLGITKASLNSDSFISAASFQETTRVLTEAAIEGRKDWLNGLKENVIIGRLIPAGTGFNYLENQKILAREKHEINSTFQKDAKGMVENILDLRILLAE